VSSAAPPTSTRRWLTDPVESGAAAGFGVYLHVPFCHHRCGYCDFATDAVGDRDDADARFGRYVRALTTDLAGRWPSDAVPTGRPPPARSSATPGRR
jgi:coproporphyrinogen III oxidase-like Fe-S oxidoreductase